ncbi:MAG: chromate efflux transporter [Betaproteobacteria bacterium]
MSLEPTSARAQPVDAVPMREAFAFWLRLGFISFGGPAGQIAIMQRELVEQRRWISEQRFVHALHYCMMLPGPEAQQLATYLGWLMHRTLGGVVAGLLFILPSMLLLIALSYLYLAHGQQPLVAALLYGVKPAVAAIVLHAVYRLGQRCLADPRRRPLPALLAFLGFFVLTFTGLSFVWLILGAVLLGLVLARTAPQALAGPSAPSDRSQAAPQRALIDVDTPPPPHTRPHRGRLALVVGVGLMLWALPMAALLVLSGPGGTLTQMAAFFTRAALLTFGGAYAVLPYVQQAAVEHYQWLSTAQMMDGLALGESTPGPLIMVVAFVAYVGGWTQQVLGPQAQAAGAALAALVACWFTFLPSFIFILAGGPWVEAARSRVSWTLPLQAVYCVVVGVIAHLGWTFLGAVAYADSRMDAVALLMVALGVFLLVRWRWSVLRLLAASAASALVLVAW